MEESNDDNVAVNTEHVEEHVGESVSRGKRPRTSTSRVWDVFQKLPADDNGKEMASCSKCNKVYVANSTAGTSNLLRHLVSCPGREPETSHGPIDQSIYREKLAKTIIEHKYPYRYVEHKATRDLHLYLNGNVKVISRNTAKADVLAIYVRERENLKKALQKARSRICLTSDLWSSSTSDGYLALTAHYVDENWTLQKQILTFHHVPPPHNGPVLAERVIHFLKEWGIDKRVFTITLDNASYNDGLVGSLKQHLRLTDSLFADGMFLHIRCGAHILNLIVQSGLKVIGEAVTNVRESVKYVRSSEARKLKFAECMVRKGGKILRQDVVTRWNSTYLMLECAIKQKVSFCTLSVLDTNFTTCPSEEEWSLVERITKFLKPFYDITTLFSGYRYPTANLYF